MTIPMLRLAVCGAHMNGLGLNHQLIERKAKLECATRTGPYYRLYLLDYLQPPRPGLVRTARDGVSIELEIWQMPTAEFGRFIQLVKPPLCIGWMTLENGEDVLGFLCEAFACEKLTDISYLGGWRHYLAQGVR